jgi:hypothetical protein
LEGLQLRIDGPLASIIITIILVTAALFGTGSFKSPQHTYATIHYDGGWTKIGIIRQERIFSNVSLSRGDETLFVGDIDSFKSYLEATSAAAGGNLDTPLSVGVVVDSQIGIKWLATENSFELITEKYNTVATKDQPIIPRNLILELETLERKAIDERATKSFEAVKYGPRPDDSFFWSKMAEFLSNMSNKY